MFAVLDLSAAFDTLDHSILLKRLEVTIGVRDAALKWFASYLSDRCQSVIVYSIESTPSPLARSTPGSVLGPVLFTLYSQPLSDVISAHGCNFHKFVDDTELSQSAHLMNFVLCRQTFRHVLKTSYLGRTAINSC